MTKYEYDRAPEGLAPLGLIVLQTDETLESDMRRVLPSERYTFVTRIPSGDDVTPDSLQQMRGHLTAAAGLLPQALKYDAIAYGCTSATAHIGAREVAMQIRAGVKTAHVTDPLTALIAACAALDIKRIALLSPYTADVSECLRDALSGAGIETPSFGSFEEAREEAVVRIAPQSIIDAACDLAQHGQCDAIFLSCTNLRTLDVIEKIENLTGLACLSSNQVLAWHLCAQACVPGRLGSLGGE